MCGTVSPDRILEIGTGSGYQEAFIISVQGVYTVERHYSLSVNARTTKRRSITFSCKHGLDGWEAFVLR